MKTYRDLIIWQKSMSFVTDIYLITKKFPNNEIYGLISQMRRSAVSIPSNIAEGYGRRSPADFLRFLHIAMGSLFELQTQIEVAANLHYITQEQFNNFYEKSREIERLLSSFIKSIHEK